MTLTGKAEGEGASRAAKAPKEKVEEAEAKAQGTRSVSLTRTTSDINETRRTEHYTLVCAITTVLHYGS
eukprot:2002024-Pleurochrysis_carterae.AAC.9